MNVRDLDWGNCARKSLTAWIAMILLGFIESCHTQEDSQPKTPTEQSTPPTGGFSEQEAQDLAALLKGGNAAGSNSEIIEEVTIGQGYTAVKSEEDGVSFISYSLHSGKLACDFRTSKSDHSYEFRRTYNTDSLEISLLTDTCFKSVAIVGPSKTMSTTQASPSENRGETGHRFSIDLTKLPDGKYELQFLPEASIPGPRIPFEVKTQE